MQINKKAPVFHLRAAEGPNAAVRHPCAGLGGSWAGPCAHGDTRGAEVVQRRGLHGGGVGRWFRVRCCSRGCGGKEQQRPAEPRFLLSIPPKSDQFLGVRSGSSQR